MSNSQQLKRYARNFKNLGRQLSYSYKSYGVKYQESLSIPDFRASAMIFKGWIITRFDCFSSKIVL